MCDCVTVHAPLPAPGSKYAKILNASIANVSWGPQNSFWYHLNLVCGDVAFSGNTCRTCVKFGFLHDDKQHATGSSTMCHNTAILAALVQSLSRPPHLYSNSSYVCQSCHVTPWSME